MKIKVMPFLTKNKNQVAKVALEFDELPGFQLTGFTICENEKKELFILYPSNQTVNKLTDEKKTWYFLRPTGDNKEDLLDKLEEDIIKAYEDMIDVRKHLVKE